VLLVDQLTHSDRDDLLQRMFAHLSLDELLDAATRLQVFLVEHPPPVELDGPEADKTLGEWLGERRADILSQTLDGYGHIPKASIYAVFEGEADFHAELARRLHSGRSGGYEGLERAAVELFAGLDMPPPLSEAVRVLTGVAFRQSIGIATYVELGATPYLGHPELAAVARAGYQEDLETLTPLYGAFLEIYDRRLRPGIGIEDLYAAIDALYLGFAFRGRVIPEQMGPESERATRLLAEAVEAIILSFTEER
jgi:hypothetical protein